MLVAFTFLHSEQNRDAYCNYVEHIINEIASQENKDQFLLITNHLFFDNLDWNENISVVQLKKPSLLVKNLAEKFQLKKIIKQQQPNVIVHFSKFVDTNIKIPQIVFLQHQPIKKEVHRLLKIKKIIVNTISFKNELVEKFLFKDEQIEVIYPQPLQNFQPLSFNEVSAVKDGYTDGREYFLFIQNQENAEQIVTTLKAFSEFKKWQKSSMKLLVVNRYNSFSNSIKEKLSTYKFKDDVVVLENLDDTKYAKIIASAYAVIYLSSNPNNVIPILEILQSQTSLITIDFNSFKEIAKDAALYFEHHSFKNLSEKMQLIYKDENLRTSIISKAQDIANEQQETNPTESFWQTIAKACTD